MKYIKILPIFMIILTLTSCAEQYVYTDKKNLNNTLNILSQGEFYACTFKNIYVKDETNNTKEDIKKIKINFNANKNINLIQNENKIGLIYKQDKWNNGNSIYVRDEKKKNIFFMTDFYSEKDLDEKNLSADYYIKFTENNLEISLFDKNIKSAYSCIKLEKILPEAMKKQLLKNFILQKNSERL
ncbi:MAG: hypothetical protein ACJ0QX_03535 [Gammaproteobacteria bacterium]